MAHKQLGRGVSSGVLTSLALILALAAPAHAASQGSLGATSTGSVTITVSVAPRVSISGLADMSFNIQDPSEVASGTQDICIWSNTASKSYTITASGSGPGGAFVLLSGAQAVPYKVSWFSTVEGGQSALSSDLASAKLTSAATHQSCRSERKSARLSVKIAPADLQFMEPRVSYVGVLNLTVSPQ